MQGQRVIFERRGKLPRLSGPVHIGLNDFGYFRVVAYFLDNKCLSLVEELGRDLVALLLACIIR